MDISLVIMAAGLGSRYGGDKQVDGIGPNGEFLMEYSVHDAIQAGFSKIVFIIKPGMEALIDRMCGRYLRGRRTPEGKPVEVRFAFQDYSSLPEWFTPPAERTKPYGTVHALLCAAEAVQEPCCVINADDYYGADAYRTIARQLAALPKGGKALMVGYRLNNTASLNGAVSRGVCHLEQGVLRGVTETKQIQQYPDGRLVNLVTGEELDPEAVVSMNFWGFAPSIFPVLRTYLEEFLRTRGGELTAECLLPVMVDELLRSGALEVEVLHSGDRWFGMTYQADRAEVAEELSKLHRAGAYPESLRA